MVDTVDNSSPCLSVVIPTINSLFRFEEKFLDKVSFFVEVIIIRQNPTYDEYVIDEIFESYSVKDVHTSRMGASMARNEGAKLAGAEVVVFLDDDVVPCQKYLESIFKLYKNNSVDIAFGRCEYVDMSCIKFEKNIEYCYEVVRSKYDAVGSAATLSARTSSLKKFNLKFIEEIGAGMDVVCGEDSVFCLQAWRKGMSIYRSHQSVVYHPEIGSTMHLRTDKYFHSYWVVMKTFYGLYGRFLAIKFSLRLLLKEKNVALFFRFFEIGLRAKRLQRYD